MGKRFGAECQHRHGMMKLTTGEWVCRGSLKGCRGVYPITTEEKLENKAQPTRTLRSKPQLGLVVPAAVRAGRRVTGWAGWIQTEECKELRKTKGNRR